MHHDHENIVLGFIREYVALEHYEHSLKGYLEICLFLPYLDREIN
jgi:hypothetical protein